MLEKNGLKVGVIGIACNIIQKNMPPAFWEGADFTDGIKEAGHHARRLRQAGADLVLLLSHLGFPQDIALLEKVAGIDLYLSGHTHNRLRHPQRVGDAYIIQSGALASSMGFLRLHVADRKIISIQHEYSVLDKSIPQDRGMLAMLRKDQVLSQYSGFLDQAVGKSRIDLHRASSFYGTMDYLLLDALRAATGLDIAFSNGWRYGGAIKKASSQGVTSTASCPWTPLVMTVEMTGEEMVQMLEDNLESTFSPPL